MMSDAEHIFIYLLLIHMSFWKYDCPGSVPIFFFSGSLLFDLVLSCVSYLYILDINYLEDNGNPL